MNDYTQSFKYTISTFISLFLSCLQEDQTPPSHCVSSGSDRDRAVVTAAHGSSDASTTNGYTPLHISAREGQVETAAVLLGLEASHSLVTKVGLQGDL